MANSQYYDPTTGMITMYRDDPLSNTSGGSLDMELGLSTFADLNDVKVKILSVEYKVRIYCDNVSISAGADNNLYAFNNESRQAGGTYMFGVKNVNDTTVFNDLTDFEGTSAWPVHITSWVAQVGLPASATKTWKPQKMAFSDEQVAFLTVRNNSGVSNAQASYSWASIVIRAIRL